MLSSTATLMGTPFYVFLGIDGKPWFYSHRFVFEQARRNEQIFLARELAKKEKDKK